MTPAPALPAPPPLPPSAYAPPPSVRAPVRAPAQGDTLPAFQIIQRDSTTAAASNREGTLDETAEATSEDLSSPLALPIMLPGFALNTPLTVMSGASKASSAIGSVNSLAGQSLAALAANDSAPADPAGFAEDLLAALGSATQQLAASTVEAAPATSAADALQAKLPDLDMSKESAWLDRLARDIAATAGDNGKLSFRLVPPQLGKLDISIETRSEGVAVQMTAETREARNIIAAAQPKLTEALGAQGVRVAEASVTSGRGEEMPRNRHLTPIQLIETAHDREADAEPQRPQRAAGRFA